MKNNRLPKWLRLALWLGLMGLMVFCLWLEAETPRFSPQGALRKSEQRGLLEYGEFLTYQYTFSDYGTIQADYFPAVSRSGTQLHTAEVYRNGLRWKPNGRALSVPIEDPVTVAALPWAINIESFLTAYPAVLVYLPQAEAARVEGTLQIQGETFHAITTGKGDNGCWLLAFESPQPEDADHILSNFHRELSAWYFNHLPLRTPFTVTVTAFDQNGGLLAEKAVEYP